MSPSQDGPARAPTRAPTILAPGQEAPAVAAEAPAPAELLQQQRPAAPAAPAAAATAAPPAPPVALIPIGAFRSNPAGILAPADAVARSALAASRVIGALPRVDTGLPSRRSTLSRLVGGLDAIEGALDAEEERAARTATFLVTARVDILTRQSDVLAEVVLSADGTETTEDGQPIACAELQALLRTKTVPGAMTAAFYTIALCIAWRVCVQVSGLIRWQRQRQLGGRCLGRVGRAGSGGRGGARARRFPCFCGAPPKKKKEETLVRRAPPSCTFPRRNCVEPTAIHLPRNHPPPPSPSCPFDQATPTKPQVRPTVTSELAAGFFYLSDLRDLARRAFGFRLRIERSGALTPVHLRVYAKNNVDFFAMIDAARAKGVERRGGDKARRYNMCAHFFPRVREQALRLAASGAHVVIAGGGSGASGGASPSSGSHAAGGSG